MCQKQFSERARLDKQAPGPRGSAPNAFKMFLARAVGMTPPDVLEEALLSPALPTGDCTTLAVSRPAGVYGAEFCSRLIYS